MQDVWLQLWNKNLLGLFAPAQMSHYLVQP